MGAVAIFSVEELWLLQSVIRHEVSQRDNWKFPPSNFDLNAQIADALLRCAENDLKEAPILLDLEMCLAIDACVPISAKDKDGNSLGKAVLLKTFAARREIDEGAYSLVDVDDAAPDDLEEQMAIFETKYKAKKGRKR